MARKRSNATIMKDNVEDDADLCVFGFEVKLFKAEANNHEGPYMIRLQYDEAIEVDRYDCRLLLHSLSDIGQQQQQSEVPDFEEDYLCDEERYLDLKNLESEKELPSPVVKTSCVPYTYDKPSPSPPVVNNVTDEPFVPNKHQHYPSGMTLPLTKKHALLIEKTAKFVVEKGEEYESSISSKISSNKNLSFISSDDPLNGYYKYVVSLIRDKIYIALLDSPAKAEAISDSADDYLSSSLMRKRKQQLGPNLNSKPVKMLKMLPSVAQKSKENNDEIDSKVYFEWYQRFYDDQSPFYPNILPMTIKPPDQLASVIREQAEHVAKNGRGQEKLFQDTDVSCSKYMHFTNPYYMYYQNHLFKKAVEIEEASKEKERIATSQEEGEIVENAFSDPVANEQELQRQLERREKAHLFLKAILNRKREQSEMEGKNPL